jgi:hypothetical protein
MNCSDKKWLEDQDRNGWIMPSAAWWMRLPIVRNIRCAVTTFLVYRNARNWYLIGIGFGLPQEFDLWVCYGISRGFERTRWTT